MQVDHLAGNLSMANGGGWAGTSLTTAFLAPALQSRGSYVTGALASKLQDILCSDHINASHT